MNRDQVSPAPNGGSSGSAPGGTGGRGDEHLQGLDSGSGGGGRRTGGLLGDQDPVQVAFARNGSGFDRIIAFGQQARGLKAPYTHVALARGNSLVQANSHGVNAAHLSDLNDVELVDVPSVCNGGLAWLFANAQVGDKYGWVTDISMGLNMLTPDRFSIRVPGTWQCAALVAESLRFGGWLYDWPDIYGIFPAGLYEALVT